MNSSHMAALTDFPDSKCVIFSSPALASLLILHRGLAKHVLTSVL